MRQRIHQSNAERQKAYRQRNNIKDTRRKRKRGDLSKLKEYYETHDRKPQPWAKRKQNDRRYRSKQRMKIPFVTIDGEGITCDGLDGRPKKVATTTKDGKEIYKHLYVLLSANDGRYIEDWKNGLSTIDCLDFLLHYSGENYVVGFGIGYDVTKILSDLTEMEFIWLWENQEMLWNDYYIKYIPNKIFTIKRNNKLVTLYDSFGFFQKSFIKSLEDWKIPCPQAIIDGKEQRGKFNLKQKKIIRDYNLIECKLLVELMNKLRDAAYKADFLPTQWYGAGAIASYMLEANGIKYVTNSPTMMIPYFLNAFYGGRNQVLKMGEFKKDVYLHDINSAYPWAMKDLPPAIGEWFEVEPQLWQWDWSLYEVEWNLPKDTLITPFPVRARDKSIHWPLRGSGWYWQPEVWEAAKVYPQYIKIKRCFCFDPIPDEDLQKPFKFIEDYYAKRQQFILEDNDAQLVLKLGINACFGKLAQSIGKRGEKPTFQDFFLAGYITSKTRAKVFNLAMQSTDDIISFSTDGIASLRQLCKHSAQKQLGEWEVKRVENYFVLQSGVYTYTDDSKVRTKSRGFRSKSVDYDALRQEWRENGVNGSYQYTESRFIGIGNGLRQDFNLIGNWIEQSREITFFPTSMSVENLDRKPKESIARHQKRIHKQSWLQLKPPQYVGESFAYEMKVNWMNHQNDFDDSANDLQTAIE